jgi:hypothetical protein
VTASALSLLAGCPRGFARDAGRARAICVGRPPSESVMMSTAARVMQKPVARPGGFGNSDRVLAGLREACGTYHDLKQRRFRARPSPLPR